MALTVYATESDLESILSEFGVEVRADDDQDGDADTGIVDAVLQRGAVRVNKFLLRRYEPAVIAASKEAIWANAYFSAEELCKRRANGVPQPILDEVERITKDLQTIKDGKEHLTTDDGMATPRHDRRPMMSNLAIDGRYGRAKVRRTTTTSTGPNQADGLKRNDEQYPYAY